MDEGLIEDFQAISRGPDGQRLVVDGGIGSRTRWALAVADLPRRRRSAIREASRFVGQREIPGQPNRGKLPDMVLAPLGLVGVPWCAAFVSYVLRSVGFGVADGFKYTARARECLAMFPQRLGPPVLGDLAGWVNPDGTGHVGIVIGLRLAASDLLLTHVILIEGNSANSVRITARPIGDLQVCALPDELQWASDVPSAPVVARQIAGTR